MTEQEPTSRPIGWWLKEADSRLEAAFDRAFAELGRSRIEWQVLSTLTARATSRDDLFAVLAPFAPDHNLLGVVEGLVERGEVVATDGQLALTDAGARAQADLAALVATVRGQVAAALPEEDYRTLVRLLARLVDGLTPP